MLQRLFHFFFPEHCRGCRKPGSALCATCIRRIPLAAPLPRGTYAVFDYGNRLVRATIRDFKYHRRSESARLLSEAALPHITEYLSTHLQSWGPEALVFVPIPEHHRKLSDRGFNQSVLLAKWWSAGITQSTVAALLHKIIFTLPQAKMSRHARLHNVKNTLSCRSILDPKQMYVVIDDVTTTGATFAEARRALTAAGATKIICIALAHGYARK